MKADPTSTIAAFAHQRLIASGSVAEVAVATKEYVDSHNGAVTPHVVDMDSSEPVELDLRGSAAEITARYAPEPPAPRSPGRPKLGVVAREVTLLPRHWEWLATQPGGASVTLRKLVEQARRNGSAADELRRATDSAYRFMTALAGDLPGFEGAIRALYAGDRTAFAEHTLEWPHDVRDHARRLAERVFTLAEQPS